MNAQVCDYTGKNYKKTVEGRQDCVRPAAHRLEKRSKSCCAYQIITIVITDHIPYNEAGKVDAHKILNNEIKGKAYLVKAKYQGDVLEKIKLVPSAFATRQAGTFEDRANQ